MIKSIVMRNHASYDSTGVSLEDCKKINFIYGPNGSGKSTISNFLKTPTDPDFHDCSVLWENGVVNEVMVYNRNFRNSNFKQTDLAGVFTLGKSTIDDIKYIDELKNKRGQIQKQIITLKNTLNTKNDEKEAQEESFRETVWKTILKGYEDDFQDAFSGLRNNKDKFYSKVLQKYAENHSSTFQLSDLKQRSMAVYGKERPQALEEIELEVERSFSEIASIECDEIWQKVVAGSSDIPISKLIQSLNNADWVSRGRQYIHSGGICPFCQRQTIDETFCEQLNLFFNNEYENDVSHIKSIVESYSVNTQIVLDALKAVNADNSKISVGKIDLSVYNMQLSLIESVFKNNLSEMQIKLSEPGRKVQIENSFQHIEPAIQTIESANRCIIDHNRLVQNYESERKKLTEDIWAFLMSKYNPLISGFLSSIKNINTARESISEKLSDEKKNLEAVSGEIIEKEKNVTSVQPTVDEINRSLKAYGFQNFQIVPSPDDGNKYQIQRPDGKRAAETLSEGEETFVSFLYFMQLAKGSVDITKVSSKKVLVLDDPISSLDSTVLYIVSAMVKDLIMQVKAGTSDVTQVFLLTHNVFFHKEASFIDGRTREDKDVNFWIIRKDSGISSIASYGMENPISTSYELLWKELKENNSAALVTVQNIMRRIIENYFNMLGRGKDQSIIHSFSSIEDQMICESLFYWINDGSHTIPDDLFIDSYSDSIEKYKAIFHQIFTVTGHEAHYNMMMGIS